MDMAWLLSMVGFLWIAAITPGPNNMLLTSTAANFSTLRTLPALVGVMLGMQILLIPIALGIGSLLTLWPSLYLSLKVLGSLYLLWIAWQIARSHYETLGVKKTRPVNLSQAALLQFLNPKAWLMVLGAVSSFSLVDAYTLSIMIISSALLAVNLLSGLIWIIFGSLISRLLRSKKAWSIFNLVMGLMTAACAVFVWL